MFARYQRSEQALDLAFMEMVVNGYPPEKLPKNCVELSSLSQLFPNFVNALIRL